MKKLILYVFIFPIFFIVPSISAHPGNTASDGCHYCRTNCEKWGEIEGARHCHGGSEPAVQTAPVYSAPTATWIPTRTTTRIPTRRPTLTPTKKPTPTIFLKEKEIYDFSTKLMREAEMKVIRDTAAKYKITEKKVKEILNKL